MCADVCVCKRERERENETERKLGFSPKRKK